MSVADIRYERLGYIALSVTDLERSKTFYREIVGTKVIDTDQPDTFLVRVSDRHHDLVFVKGDKPALKRVGWQMESAKALAAVREHLSEIGIAVQPVSAAEAAALGIGEAFRAVEPTTGTTFEFYDGMESATPFEPTHTHVARLGHMILNSPDKEATERFLLEELNFRVSDRIGEAVTFMRCFPNPLHHSFGVGRGEAASFGHLNFMVSDIDDIGRANNRMKKNNVKITYGPGRHPTSGSVFFYFLDPDEITVEYSFGMEEFPEHEARDPRLFPLVPESFDTWGGTPEKRETPLPGVEPFAAA